MTGREERSRDVAYALLATGLFAAYLAMHPYRGIFSDALIYVTPEWAPPVILRDDMLFANESQTRLTLFGAVLRPLLAFLPVDEAARLMALAGISLWFGGLLLFAHALARAAKADRFAALLMAALVGFAPLNYSSGAFFIPGETLAVPRPFAEGFVLVAFAGALRANWMAAGAALVIAGLWHPLMALAGGSVLVFRLALADRRWMALFGAGALAVAAAGWLGAPFASDLFRTPSPEWEALLRGHTTYLFISSGPVSFWVDLALRAAVVFAAARLRHGPVRPFLIAVLLAAAAGVLLSLLFSDAVASLLVMRLQPWRVLFVLAIVAPMAVGLLAVNLREGGAHARLLLAVAACAYASRDPAPVSLFFSAVLVAFSLRPALAQAVSLRSERLLWALAALFWLAFDMLQFAQVLNILAGAPEGAVRASHFWTLRPLALPLSAAFIWLSTRGRAPRSAPAAAFTVACCALAYVSFDDRMAADRALERGDVGGVLAALPKGDAPVLWLGVGKEAWYGAKRPNWVAPVQASSIVFSRALAAQWEERTRFLVANGLEPPEIMHNKQAAVDWRRVLTRDKIATVCARPDAPAAIVAPLEDGDAAPEGARIAPAAAPFFEIRVGADLRFVKKTAYAVYLCPPAD